MDQFVSEAITVDVESMRVSTLASGAPCCPRRFSWRGQWYEVVEVLAVWKATQNEGGRASGETYVRSHRFRVLTAEGLEAVIYCDRQISKNKKTGWWLYTVKYRDGVSAT